MSDVNASEARWRRQLEEEVVRRLAELGVTVDRQDRGGTARLVASVPTRESPTTLQVEIDEGHASSRLLTQSHGATEPQVLVARRAISSTLGERLRAAGVPYIDTAGNAWLSWPGFHVLVDGRKADLPPRTGARRTPPAFRPAGLRLLFALLVRPDLLDEPLRAMAAAAEISVGATHAAVKDLRNGGHLYERASGQLVLTRPGRLADLWITHYLSTFGDRVHEEQVEGPPPDWWLRESVDVGDAQFGGETALAMLGYPLRPGATVVYGRPPWGAVRKAGRLRTGGAPTVILRERFWSPTLLGSSRTTPSLLVYADAMASGDGRQAEVAQQMWESDEALRRLRDSR